MATALVLTVPAGEAELASDALWALGVLAVEERTPAGAGATTPDGTTDDLVELWTSLGDDVESVARAAGGFPSRWRWRLVEVDPAVADGWREHVAPSWVADDLVVVPAWIPFEPPAHAPADLVVLRIEPGSAFGLGDHPTTVLALRALRAALWRGASVLDVGCGSGVLAVAAARLGAASVEAIDISPAAVDATTANAAANGVAPLVHVSTMPLAALDGPYDVVVANILAPTLIELADDLRRVLDRSGLLVVSGLLADRTEHVVEALAPLVLVDRTTRQGWTALTFRW
jgi:ribosomal protein L11 methyltransferase